MAGVWVGKGWAGRGGGGFAAGHRVNSTLRTPWPSSLGCHSPFPFARFPLPTTSRPPIPLLSTMAGRRSKADNFLLASLRDLTSAARDHQGQLDNLNGQLGKAELALAESKVKVGM